MKTTLIVPLIASLLLVGCGDGGKKNSESSNPITAPVDYIGAVTKAQTVAEKTVDVASLTKAIQMFQVEEGRLPKTLNELVEKKYLPKLPEPPAGQQLSYDPNTGKVKIVAK
jgi:ABC-type Fe3+-hydroxamate transport system substrate-binding protein